MISGDLPPDYQVLQSRLSNTWTDSPPQTYRAYAYLDVSKKLEDLGAARIAWFCVWGPQETVLCLGYFNILDYSLDSAEDATPRSSHIARNVSISRARYLRYERMKCAALAKNSPPMI